MIIEYAHETLATEGSADRSTTERHALKSEISIVQAVRAAWRVRRVVQENVRGEVLSGSAPRSRWGGWIPGLVVSRCHLLVPSGTPCCGQAATREGLGLLLRWRRRHILGVHTGHLEKLDLLSLLAHLIFVSVGPEWLLPEGRRDRTRSNAPASFCLDGRGRRHRCSILGPVRSLSGGGRLVVPGE